MEQPRNPPVELGDLFLSAGGWQAALFSNPDDSPPKFFQVVGGDSLTAGRGEDGAVRRVARESMQRPPRVGMQLSKPLLCLAWQETWVQQAHGVAVPR